MCHVDGGREEQERRKEGRNLQVFFFIANTLFLSGREVKRQKHISIQPLRQGGSGHNCHFILFSLVYPLFALFPSNISLLFSCESHSMSLIY